MRKLFSNASVIFKKEWTAYFHSAIAYVFLIVFSLLTSGIFITQFFLSSRADMRAHFYALPFFLLIFLPAISMRLWADEWRGNTRELLLTFPISTASLTIGKFLAGLMFYLLALVCNAPIAIMVGVLGNPDWGMIVGGFLGAGMLGGFFLGIGILVSGFCKDQIVALILSVVVCFGLYFLGAEFVATSIDGWTAGLGSFLKYYIGAAEHYSAFAKGVIVYKDILYFLSGIALTLFLNIFWNDLAKRSRGKIVFVLAGLLCLGIFIFVNLILGAGFSGRIDLTQNKIWTIPDSTKKILQDLSTPVRVQYFVSSKEKMPTSMKSLEQDIRDRLEEWRAASHGNFQYEIILVDVANLTEKDTRKKSQESDLAEKGIVPFQVESIQADEVGVRLVYSGISIAYKDKPEEILPQIHFANLDDLEYVLISKIYRLTLPEIPKIALVAPYKERSIDPNVMALLTQLGGQLPESYREDPYEFLEKGLEAEGYPVSRITLNEKTELSEEVRVLIIIEPEAMTKTQKEKIVKFLSVGGAVFIAVQNYEFHYKPDGETVSLVPDIKNPEINDMLSNWGLEVSQNIFCDAQTEAITLSRSSANSLFALEVPVNLPVQTLLTDAEMNGDISITSRIPAIFYLWGSAIKINDKKINQQKLRVKTLFHSTKEAWEVPFKEREITEFDLNAKNKISGGVFPLAILVEGNFENIKDEKGAGKADEGKLILTGAATPFQKQMIASGGHLNFFLNSVDALALGDKLIGVRSKNQASRVLPRVSTGEKIAWKFFVITFAPILVAAVGGFVFVLRRHEKNIYLKNISDK